MSLDITYQSAVEDGRRRGGAAVAGGRGRHSSGSAS